MEHFPIKYSGDIYFDDPESESKEPDVEQKFTTSEVSEKLNSLVDEDNNNYIQLSFYDEDGFVLETLPIPLFDEYNRVIDESGNTRKIRYEKSSTKDITNKPSDLFFLKEISSIGVAYSIK